MSVVIPDVAATRGAMVNAYRDALAALVEDATQSVGGPDPVTKEPVPVGEWDGVPVVTRRALDEAIAAVFNQPIPAASETWAEVRTPATVVVAAVCPKCHLPQSVLVALSPVLEVDDTSSEIKVKAKAKARTHVCGQLPIDATPAGAGDSQTDLEGAIETLVDRVYGLLELVLEADAIPDIDAIRAWDRPTIDQVERWAAAEHLFASDNLDVERLPLPRVLGGEADPDPEADANDVDFGEGAPNESMTCPVDGCPCGATTEDEHDTREAEGEVGDAEGEA